MALHLLTEFQSELIEALTFSTSADMIRYSTVPISSFQLFSIYISFNQTVDSQHIIIILLVIVILLNKLKKHSSTVTVFWIILAIDKITAELKETWKQYFTKKEKHQRDNNKPERKQDG